jgi:hypothetical protein
MAQLPVIPLSAREFPREQFCLVYQSGASFGPDEMGTCIERVPAQGLPSRVADATSSRRIPARNDAVVRTPSRFL